MEQDKQQEQLDRIEKTLTETNKNVEILVTAVHGDQRRGAKGLMVRVEALETRVLLLEGQLNNYRQRLIGYVVGAAGGTLGLAELIRALIN